MGQGLMLFAEQHDGVALAHLVGRHREPALVEDRRHPLAEGRRVLDEGLDRVVRATRHLLAKMSVGGFGHGVARGLDMPHIRRSVEHGTESLTTRYLHPRAI